eukprot:gene7580-9081_t
MSDTQQPSRYLNDEWVAYLDDSGEEYYYNLYTTETTWDLPDLVVQADVAITDTTDSVQLEVLNTEVSPASEVGVTVRIELNEKVVDDDTVCKEKVRPANNGSELSAATQEPSPAIEESKVTYTATVTEPCQIKPQKPPKAFKALLVAKSTSKEDDTSRTAENGECAEAKPRKSFLANVVADVDTSSTASSATEAIDSDAADNASAIAVVAEESQPAAVELPSEQVANASAVAAQSTKTPIETPALPIEPESPTVLDSVQGAVETSVSVASTESEQEAPSAVQGRVTSTGKVSALAKMFSRPGSTNNMKSADPLSPQGNDSVSPVRSPNNSGKNAGLWGPSVRNKSNFTPKSPQKSSGSVLFMTSSSPKTKEKPSMDKEQDQNQGLPAESADTDLAEASESKPETAVMSAGNCDDNAPPTSSRQDSTQSSESALSSTDVRDRNEDGKKGCSLEAVQPAVAVRVKPPRPPPPSSPRPISVRVTSAKEAEATEELRNDLNEIDEAHPATSANDSPERFSEPAEPADNKPPAIDRDTDAGVEKDEAGAVSQTKLAETITVETSAPPLLERAVSAPVELCPADPGITSDHPASATNLGTIPATAVRSASVQDSVPAKVKPPKPPKNISAKVTPAVSAPASVATEMEIERATEAASQPVPAPEVSLPQAEPVLDCTTHDSEEPKDKTLLASDPPEQIQIETDVQDAHGVDEEQDSKTAVQGDAVGAPASTPVTTSKTKARPGKFEDTADSDSDYGEIEMEILPSLTAPEEELASIAGHGKIDTPGEVEEKEEEVEVKTPIATEPMVVVEATPVDTTVVELAKEAAAPAEAQPAEAPPTTVSANTPSSADSPVSAKATVVKPPKPAKRVPPVNNNATATATVSMETSAALHVNQPQAAAVSLLTSTTKEDVISVEESSAAELAARPLPPPPPPSRDQEGVLQVTHSASAGVDHPDVTQPTDDRTSLDEPHQTHAEELPLHETDANLVAELAALEIEVDPSDKGECASDTSSVYLAGHAAELKAALEAIEILAGEIEMVEAEDMGAEDEYSSSREKHESLHLPPPPSLSPPPPPPVHLKNGATAVPNPFEEDDTEDSGFETETGDNGDGNAGVEDTAAVPVHAQSVRNAPGAGKIGVGRTMGTWNSHTASADASVSGTRKAPLQFDPAPSVPASGKRAMGQWDQRADSPTVCDPPVQKESAFSAHMAKNPPSIPTAKAISPSTPAAPVPVAAVAVSGGRSIGAWGETGGASPLTAPANDANPRYAQHHASSSTGATSREASPGPGARQMSPLLAIALSKKAEAARGRSPQPMQSSSRNSSVNDFPHSDTEFDGFDGGRASDVHSLVGYKGVPITHSHSKTGFGGPSAVGGSMGSSPYNSPEGSTRDDAPVGYLQRTNTGQVRKRNPRPSEVLTGLDEGMEALNSIVLKKLMRIGVKYLPAKEALQRCVTNTSAVNHYYNALSLVRTSMLAGLGMDPYGAQLWSPRITSRIKSWLPNLLDAETKDFHTGYIMLVSYQRLADNQLISWQLTLRYSVFRNLNNKVSKYIAGTSIDSRVHFPSKVSTFFMGITDKVRNERMNQLDLWMREILNSALVMTIPEVADAVLEVLEVESRVSD